MPRHAVSTSFKPGQSGNPGGQSAARKKLGKAFIEAMSNDFEANGKAAIEKLRTERPEKYCELIAHLLPTETNVNVEQTGKVTHEHVELPRVIERATELLQRRLDKPSQGALPN